MTKDEFNRYLNSAEGREWMKTMEYSYDPFPSNKVLEWLENYPKYINIEEAKKVFDDLCQEYQQ